MLEESWQATACTLDNADQSSAGSKHAWAPVLDTPLAQEYSSGDSRSGDLTVQHASFTST